VVRVWHCSILCKNSVLSVNQSIHNVFLCSLLNNGDIFHIWSSVVFFLLSQSLSAVELNNSSLINLSLAGCRSMTFLKLACSKLQMVNLDGCDHLESASFCPVSIFIRSTLLDLAYFLELCLNKLTDMNNPLLCKICVHLLEITLKNKRVACSLCFCLGPHLF
jgi:hypothetical protein